MNVTLVHAGALGDTLLLIPLLRALAARFPAAVRTVVTHPEFGRLLLRLGHAEAAANVDAADHTRWFAPDGGPEPLAPAWSRCDLLLSAVASPADPWAYHARAALARHAPHARLFCFDPRPPADYPHHVTAFHRAQLAALALPLPAGPPVKLNPHGPILLHPGGGSLAKCWPLENFLALADRLSRRPVVFVWGPAEAERLPVADLTRIRRRFPTHECPPLVALANLLATAAAYLGHDSGPTHLAAALGLPTCVLFGPTRWQTWHPLGPAVHILPAPSLADLSVATVVAHLRGALERHPPFAPA